MTTRIITKTQAHDTREIDCTPTWSAILPILLHAAANPRSAGHDGAMSELRRMAALADSVAELEAALAAPWDPEPEPARPA